MTSAGGTGDRMVMLGGGELDRRLAYHPPGPGTVPLYELNRALIRLTAAVWDATLPSSRELALAQTALEDALMRANQAVACNLDPAGELPPAPDVATLLDDVLERLEGPILTRSGPDSARSWADGPPEGGVEIPGTFSSPPVTLTPEQVQGLTPREVPGDDVAPCPHPEPCALHPRTLPPELTRIRGDEGASGPILTRSGPAGLCGHVGPRGTACIEPAGHAGADNRGESHGDGTVARWLVR